MNPSAEAPAFGTGPTPPRLFFLTGPVHSGKTTFLRQLAVEARRRGVKVSGYLSPSVCDRGERVGYDLETLADGATCPFLRKEGGAGLLRAGPYGILPEALELAILTIRTSAGKPLVIVDELGPLELSGEGVWPAVAEAVLGPAGRLILVVRDTLLEAFLGRTPAGRAVRVFGAADRTALAGELGL